MFSSIDIRLLWWIYEVYDNFVSMVVYNRQCAVTKTNIYLNIHCNSYKDTHSEAICKIAVPKILTAFTGRNCQRVTFLVALR